MINVFGTTRRANKLFEVDINTAAEESYLKIHTDCPDYPLDKIHRRGFCRQTTAYMLPKLFGIGYPVLLEQSKTDSWLHYFLTIYGYLGLEKVADPTWQQFRSPLPMGDGVIKHPETLPKVLIGTREEVIAQAIAGGVRKVVATTLYTPPSPRLVFDPGNQIYDVLNVNAGRNMSPVDREK